MKKISYVLMLVLVVLVVGIYSHAKALMQKTDNGLKLFVDKTNGYSIGYPQSMKVDTSLEPIRTVFYDNNTKIEIYYDDFHNTISTSEIYMDYSNRFLNNTTDHVLDENKTIKVNGKDAHYLKWHRQKLTRVKQDKNYYVTVEIPKNELEIYSIFIKSDRPIENELEIINQFQMIEKTDTTNVQAHFKKLPLKTNDETTQVYNHYFLSNKKLTWGIFEPEAPDSFVGLNKLENDFNYTFDFLVRYQSLDSEGVPKEALANAYNNHRIVELTLQTMKYGQDNSSITYDILNGKYDAYLHQYAKDIKAFGHPVLFRLNNEMNGDWVVYSSYFSAKDTDLYKEVWKYMYSIFKENQVDNVLWVWNPNHASLPAFAWNDELMYYPGDEYVDIVGLTAYNTGTYYSGETWSTFQELYDPLYKRYSSLFDKPLMITEFASSSIGGDKGKWIEDMFNTIGQYPQIKAAIWWSGVDMDGSTQARIYKIDENRRIMDIFAHGLELFK